MFIEYNDLVRYKDQRMLKSDKPKWRTDKEGRLDYGRPPSNTLQIKFNSLYYLTKETLLEFELDDSLEYYLRDIIEGTYAKSIYKRVKVKKSYNEIILFEEIGTNKTFCESKKNILIGYNPVFVLSGIIS